MLVLVWLALAQAVLANGKPVSRSRQRLDKRTGQWVDVEARQLDLGLGGPSNVPTFPAGAAITFITQFTSSSDAASATSAAASSAPFSGVAASSDSPIVNAPVFTPSSSADPSPVASAAAASSSSAGLLPTLDLTPDPTPDSLSSASTSGSGALLTLFPAPSSSSTIGTSTNGPPVATTSSDNGPASVSSTQSSSQTTAALASASSAAAPNAVSSASSSETPSSKSNPQAHLNSSITSLQFPNLSNPFNSFVSCALNPSFYGVSSSPLFAPLVSLWNGLTSLSHWIDSRIPSPIMFASAKPLPNGPRWIPRPLALPTPPPERRFDPRGGTKRQVPDPSPVTGGENTNTIVNTDSATGAGGGGGGATTTDSIPPVPEPTLGPPTTGDQNPTTSDGITSSADPSTTGNSPSPAGDPTTSSPPPAGDPTTTTTSVTSTGDALGVSTTGGTTGGGTTGGGTTGSATTSSDGVTESTTTMLVPGPNTSDSSFLTRTEHNLGGWNAWSQEGGGTTSRITTTLDGATVSPPTTSPPTVSPPTVSPPTTSAATTDSSGSATTGTASLTTSGAPIVTTASPGTDSATLTTSATTASGDPATSTGSSLDGSPTSSFPPPSGSGTSISLITDGQSITTTSNSAHSDTASPSPTSFASLTSFTTDLNGLPTHIDSSTIVIPPFGGGANATALGQGTDTSLGVITTSAQTTQVTTNQGTATQDGASTDVTTTSSSASLTSLVLFPTSSETTASTSSVSTTTNNAGTATTNSGVPPTTTSETSSTASATSLTLVPPSSSETSTTSVDITSGQFQTTTTNQGQQTTGVAESSSTIVTESSSSVTSAAPQPTTTPPLESSTSGSGASSSEQPPSSSDGSSSASQASTSQDPVITNSATTTAGPSSVASEFSSISSAIDEGFNNTATTTPILTSVSPPATSGSQVTFFSDPLFTSSSGASSSASASDSSSNDNYVPTQSFLIVATTTSSSSASSSGTTTAAPSLSGSDQPTSTTALPTTAQIPSSVPTLIVPQNSIANNPNAGTGKADDPIKDDTLISLLLAADEYPWVFVVNSSDATSQLFNTFPTLISNALNIPVTDVKTYGLQVYQPASWNGDQTGLLTQWLAYIPSDQFDTLNAYLKTQTSPLFTQPGIQGDLAQQINTAYPLAASPGVAITPSGEASQAASSTRTRDIIIGVSVGVGGTLWIALIYWIYRRVKRSNEKAVHKRLSEHMSMFVDDRYAYADEPQMTYRQQRPMSQVPSVAGSDVDDRPSSFYASPLENDPAMRRQQREADRIQRHSYGSDSGDSYNSQDPFSNSAAASLGHSGHSGAAAGQAQGQGQVFGGSWFNANQARAQSPPAMRQAVNPFEDFVTRSYIGPSGSTGSMGGMNPQRRSALGKPVQKAMISQPTLHASSLEFREY